MIRILLDFTSRVKIISNSKKLQNSCSIEMNLKCFQVFTTIIVVSKKKRNVRGKFGDNFQKIHPLFDKTHDFFIIVDILSFASTT